VSRYRYTGLRLHAHMDQAGQGKVAPSARQGLEAAGGARLIDLQTALADSRHLAEHRHEALLIHPLEQLQGLEAVAPGVLAKPIWLLGPQISAADAAASGAAVSACTVATRGEQNLCGDKPAASTLGLKHLYSFCSVAAVALGGAFLGQQPCSSNPAFW